MGHGFDRTLGNDLWFQQSPYAAVNFQAPGVSHLVLIVLNDHSPP